MLDVELDVLGEEDLALLSRRFERMYTNWKNARRSSGMCYRCGKHGHFIAECLEAMEVKSEHKHRPRTDHKHCSRDDSKGKNKSERRPRKSGGHKKKGRAMVAGTSNTLATLHQARVMKKRTGTRASGRARTSKDCALPPKAFAVWHIAVDAKCAPSAKHTASRTSWLHTCRDHKKCQSIFPEN
jgi:hypothetical protein